MATKAAEASDLRTTEPTENWSAQIETAAEHFGCEAWRMETTFGSLERELPTSYPALVGLSELHVLAILRATKKHVLLLGPDLAHHRRSIAEVCHALRAQSGVGVREDIERILSEAGVPRSSRGRVADLISREEMDERPFYNGWVLHPSPGASIRKLVGHSSLPVHGVLLIIAHASQYLLWLASWIIMGRLSLAGRIDHGWLWAWALALLTLIPFRLLTTWLQGLLAIGAGGLLKQRLLYGAMKLSPEEIKHCGIGDFLSQTLEAETVETLALGSGVQGLLAVAELVVSAFILGWLSAVLLAWCVLAGFFLLAFWRRYQSWTEFRLSLTHDLVEAMLGHKTRLAQQPKADWHKAEDESHAEYFDLSRCLDRTGQLLLSFIPRGWLAVGLGCLIPSIVSHASSTSGIAVLLGGVLLSYSAITRLTRSFSEMAAAGVAWKRVAPLFHAAGRTESRGVAGAEQDTVKSGKLIEADRLTYRYRPTGNPVLQECSLAIERGERVLLEGASGGGKTTFASLICGMRKPESGLLLVDGLDQHTLGAEGWRKRIAAAPQFHENHILTETLAFNLLMGRRWPPTARDFDDAMKVCRRLGLGALLDTMPSGLMQMVGEGGWQLSHGERSRVYIARALLQRSELVVLDESFAALDPENLRTALEFTLEEAGTLLVIAHP